MLKCERNTPTMETKVRRAFRKFLKAQFGTAFRLGVSTVYEHGQWWAIYEQDGFQDIYSVVDSEGMDGIHTFDGFGFERI